MTTVPNHTVEIRGRLDEGHRERKWRFGAFALLVSMFVQGLPLGRDLGVSEPRLAEQQHLAALEAATTLGIQNTFVMAVIWGTLYSGAALTIYRYGQRSFVDALRRQWPISLLSALVLMSALWATNLQPVLVSAAHSFGVVLLSFAASMFYRNKPCVFVRHVASVLGLNALVQIGSVLLVPGVAVSYDGRWTGLTGNANTLGAIGALTLWAALGAIVLSTGRIRLVYVGPVILALAVLYGSSSVTAAVSCAVAVIGMLLLRKVAAVARHPVIMLLVTMLIVIVVVWIGADTIRYDVFPALGRSADLSGRVEIWTNAVKLIEQHPFLGWGFDNNARVIQMSGLPTLHFHNGYMDLAIRGGVVAVALVLCAVFVMLASLSRQDGRTAAVGLSFLTMTMIYNLTEVTFAAPRNPFWILLLCIAFTALGRKAGHVR